MDIICLISIGPHDRGALFIMELTVDPVFLISIGPHDRRALFIVELTVDPVFLSAIGLNDRRALFIMARPLCIPPFRLAIFKNSYLVFFLIHYFSSIIITCSNLQCLPVSFTSYLRP